MNVIKLVLAAIIAIIVAIVAWNLLSWGLGMLFKLALWVLAIAVIGGIAMFVYKSITGSMKKA